MNEIINKFLLAEGKFFIEMDLITPGFKYSACGKFTLNREGTQIDRSRIFKIHLSKRAK